MKKYKRRKLAKYKEQQDKKINIKSKERIKDK